MRTFLDLLGMNPLRPLVLYGADDDGGSSSSSDDGGGSDDSGQSFSDAFASARAEQGSGGTFEWQGNSYTTNYAGEDNDPAPAAATTTAATTTSRDDDDDGGSVISNITRDIQMGLGIIEQDQDFVDRTAATIERTQGSDAASNYAAGRVDDGFVDNYNVSTVTTADTAATPRTDFSDAASFSEAFAAARESLGAGKTFTFGGQEYSTAIAGEDPELDAAIAAQTDPVGTSATEAYGQLADTMAGSGALNLSGATGLTDQQLADDAMGVGSGVGFPDLTEDVFGPFLPGQEPEDFDPGSGPTIFTGGIDASDPRGDQIVSPTGTGIGISESQTPISDELQETLDQIGGGAGTTIEDLLPPGEGEGTGTTLQNMEQQERFERQSELADADPTGQSTATGTLLSDGTAIDTFVVDDPVTGGPATFEVTTLPDGESSTQQVNYTDDQGNQFNTLSGARLSGAENINRVTSPLQTSTQRDPRTLAVTQAGFLPDLSNVGAGITNLLSSLRGDPATATDPAPLPIDDPNADTFTLSDGTIIRRGEEGTGNLFGQTLADAYGLVQSGKRSIGNLFGFDMGTGKLDDAALLSQEQFRTLTPEMQQRLTDPIYGEDGINFSALTAKVGRTAPIALAAISNPLIAGGLTVGDVGLASDQAIDQAFDAGEFGPASPEYLQSMKDEARLKNTIPAAALGYLSNLIPGFVSKTLPGRIAASAGEEAVQEGFFEPNLAAFTASAAGDFDYNPTFDPEAATVGGLTGAGAAVLPGMTTRTTQTTRADGAGPQGIQTGSPAGPAAPAGDVISGAPLLPRLDGIDTPPTTSVAPAQVVAPAARDVAPSITIPGTNVTVQQISPAQIAAPTQADSNVGVSSLGTGGSFQQPTTPLRLAPPPSQENVVDLPSRLNLSVPEVQTESPTLDMSQANVSVGDTIGGLSISDSQGVNLGGDSLSNLDPRRTNPGSFMNLQGENVGTINQAPIGEPVGRLIQNEDGSSTIQVGSRIEGGQTGARDNFTSVAVTVPPNATAEQLNQANREALQNWRSNYEGVTSSDQLQANTGRVSVTEGPAGQPITEPEIGSNVVDMSGMFTRPEAGDTVPTVDLSRLNQPQVQDGIASLPAGDVITNQAAADAAMGRVTPEVDISRINQVDPTRGLSPLQLTPEMRVSPTAPEIIQDEVASTGALSNETAQRIALENNLSMQEVANIAEQAMGVTESQATGPRTEVDVAQTIDLADATPSANQLAADEAMGRGEATEFVFEGEVLSPEAEVSVDVETPAEGQTIEGTLGSRDVATTVDVPVDTTVDGTTRPPIRTTVPPVDTTVTTERTTARGTDTAPRDEDEDVTVEVEDPSGPGGPGDEDDGITVAVGEAADDDDEVTQEDAPFECPDGYEAVLIDGEWRCQKIDAEPEKVRPTGGSYYQPRNPSLAATAKAYRFR